MKTLFNAATPADVEYSNTRTIAYRDLLSARLLREAASLSLWFFIGFFGLFLLTGTTMTKEALVYAAPLLAPVIGAVIVVNLCWRLFGIWSLAPGPNDPAEYRMKLMIGDHYLIFRTDNAVVRLAKTDLKLWYRTQNFTALCFTSLPIILSHPLMSEEAQALLSELIAQQGKRATFFNAHGLLKPEHHPS